MPGKEERRAKKLANLDSNKRLNRIVDRRYDRYDRQKLKAQSKKPLEKLEKKKGYNYSIGEYDPETQHWYSLSSTGEVAKAKKHPSMIKTRKAEKLLGNKIVNVDGKRYSVPKNQEPYNPGIRTSADSYNIPIKNKSIDKINKNK